MRKVLFAAIAALSLSPVTSAQPYRAVPDHAKGERALAEVNAKRAARGLRPFAHDPALSEAAYRCASFRAAHRMFGHTANDFAFLPPGAAAASMGCAAYPDHYGWMTCCTYENYRSAGAAWVRGPDNLRYMHLVVR